MIMYDRFVKERFKHIKLDDIFPILEQAIKEWDGESKFSEFVLTKCSHLTGIPDEELFIHNEMLNTRIIISEIELIDQYLTDKLGITVDDMYQAHLEYSHHEDN